MTAGRARGETGRGEGGERGGGEGVGREEAGRGLEIQRVKFEKEDVDVCEKEEYCMRTVEW